MEIAASAAVPITVGHCLEVSGAVSLGDATAVAGMPLNLTQILETAAGAFVHIKLRDGTRLVLGHDSALRVDGFRLDCEDDDDGAHVSLLHGALVLGGGRISRGIDAFVLQAGAMSLSVRAAKLAVRLDAGGAGMVTLLASEDGPDGEVLVHNKVGVEILSRVHQTICLTGGASYLAPPLTIPSSVVMDSYGESGLGPVVVPLASLNALDDGFEPFLVSEDRLFERRFVSRDLFPIDTPRPDGDTNGLLEDAFDGVRFRLPDDEAFG